MNDNIASLYQVVFRDPRLASQYFDLARQGAVFRDPRLVAIREQITTDEIGLLARQMSRGTLRDNHLQTCLEVLWKRQLSAMGIY
jgi:hypothetical protein